MPPFMTPYDPTGTLGSSMAGIDPTGGQTPQLTQPPTPEDDEDARFQAMLAPYKVAAQKLYGGNPVFGNSSFATNHPDLAGHLSNILLAAASYKPGSTVGENIASAARMAIAPEQIARQRAVAQMMYPYQMLKPQLDIAHSIAEDSELQQRGDYYQGAGANLANARASEQRAQAASRLQGKPVENTDQYGHQWWVAPDGSSKSVDPGYVPHYIPILETQLQIRHAQALQNGAALGGSLQGRLLAGAHPGSGPNGEYTQEDYLHTLIPSYDQMQGAVAGTKAAASTAGTQTTPHPFTDKQTFLKMQEPHIYDGITNKPPKDILDSMLQDASSPHPPKDAQKSFQDKVAAYAASKTKVAKQFYLYMTSSDAEARIPFDPNKDYSKEQASSPANQSSKSNSFNVSTPNWKPQK